MRLVTRLLSPPPADVRAALRTTADEARALGLDHRAHMLAAAIVAGSTYNPPFIAPAVAAAIAERWATVVDGVRTVRPRLHGGRAFVARCPACRQRMAWYRGPCLGNNYEGEAHCGCGTGLQGMELAVHHRRRTDVREVS